MNAAYPFIRSSMSPREWNVTAGTTIAPGDFLWWDGTTLKPIGGSANLVRAWSSESRARRDATGRFAGIADFRAMSDDKFDVTRAIPVCGIAEVACTSCTPHAGDLFGFEKDAGGNYLYSQQLQLVTHPFDAVAYCVKDYAAATTSVQVAWFSALMLEDTLKALVNRTPTFYVTAALYSAGGDYFLGYTFGERVRLLRAIAHVNTLTAAAGTVTFTTTTGVLDNTLVIPDASVVGTVVFADLAPGGVNPDNDYCEHDDTLRATGDATPTAGSVEVAVEYMIQPLAA
jgi:hypothetical protein